MTKAVALVGLQIPNYKVRIANPDQPPWAKLVHIRRSRGVYYDWYSGTYRSVDFGNPEVGWGYAYSAAIEPYSTNVPVHGSRFGSRNGVFGVWHQQTSVSGQHRVGAVGSADFQATFSADVTSVFVPVGANGRGYTIDMQRIAESPNATVSEFTAYGPAPLKPVTGYILEPGGPSTTTENQDKRILAGTYSVDSYTSKKYSNHYIVSNTSVSQDRRILIHSGNYHSNTLGCLLPGSSYSMVSGNYAVWNSGTTLNSLRSLLGGNSATLNIYNINIMPTFNFSNW